MAGDTREGPPWLSAFLISRKIPFPSPPRRHGRHRSRSRLLPTHGGNRQGGIRDAAATGNATFPPAPEAARLGGGLPSRPQPPWAGSGGGGVWRPGP